MTTTFFFGEDINLGIEFSVRSDCSWFSKNLTTLNIVAFNATKQDADVVASLPLPVAGLMSDQPIAAVRHAYDQLLAAAHALGSPLHDPFMAMSFMALEVIPKLKLTDQGLVDVEKFDLVDLFV